MSAGRRELFGSWLILAIASLCNSSARAFSFSSACIPARLDVDRILADVVH